uniref:Cytochrome P450 4ED1 n=1 Tax=Propylea japonica TaxID=158624 RepID=X4R5C9_9CUCU|nr:cytochrome P450 4ED1 [Propylea japonica]
MIIHVIVLLIVLYCWKDVWNCFRVWYLLRKFDGPKPSSLIFGNWDVVCAPPDKLFKNIHDACTKYYPHCYLRILNVCALLMTDPDDCEIFLSTTKHTKKSLIYDIFGRWLQDGLLLSKGAKWQHRRKILTPAFHFSLLKDFVKTFNEKTDELVANLTAKGSNAISIVPEMQEFSLLTINETAMGIKMNLGDEKHKAYREGISKMEELFNQFIVRPWLTSHILRKFTSFPKQEFKVVKVLHQYTKSIIKKRMDETNEIATEKNVPEKNEMHIGKKKRRKNMLDILIEAHNDGNQIDYRGICEEVDTFTFEGHDTVSSALSFCMMLIANHPEIQNRILEEIHSILGAKDEHPSYEDLVNMEYLERCIKESLRLYPSVHIISRATDEDTKLKSGLIVPKDAVILIPIISVHRNPNIYPDPEKFDPDRFLLDNCLKRHPFAYIPFSAGPRNCIGQRFAMLEMKAVLSAVIKKFELIPVDTPKTIHLNMETILRAKNGIRIKFLPRVG